MFTVKFIREVTPYIKKPSLVSDLPWEGAAPQSPSFSGSEDSGSPKHQNSTKDRAGMNQAAVCEGHRRPEWSPGNVTKGRLKGKRQH